MEINSMSFADSEWRVMEFLWERSHCTGREASIQMQSRWGWSRSTTLTLLRRLETKGAVTSETVDGVKVFRPLVRREDAELRQTEDFLKRVYKGSISLMVSSLTKKQALSQKEIAELHALLDGLEVGSDASMDT